MHAPTIEPFSGGYHLVTGLVMHEEADASDVHVQEGFYGMLQDEYYRDVSAPILFQHPESAQHFEVYPSGDTGYGVIDVPAEFLRTIDALRDGGPFLMARPAKARQIYQFSQLGSLAIDH